ncbi:MAG: FtsH protease activity modulator HflK [Alphaproteobacteria bacterium]|nr:MAG: FtsH protease activity modulator HflK [Alphaproteobacteria bacterium]
MPWQHNNGGRRNPWGSGPQRGGGTPPPNFDEWIRKSQQRLRRGLPGGGGRGILMVVIGILLLWTLFSSVYRINAGEQGVVLRFGKYVRSEPAGLHFKLPAPIETVIKANVERVNRIDVGFRQNRAGQVTDVGYDAESLMLTGDENIVDINFTVFWRIKPEAGAAGQFLFNIQRPQETTIKDVAESAMREVVGQGRLQQALTEGRGQIESDVFSLMQSVLDKYGAGVQITEVRLEKVDPPAAVIDAFRDVQAAQADRERFINEAQAYRNDIVPRARGEATQIVKAAEAYKQEVIARAQGEAARFVSVYKEYATAKDVTRKRIYLETMEDILSHMNKMLIDENAAAGVVPYLPLPGLEQQRQGGRP